MKLATSILEEKEHREDSKVISLVSEASFKTGAGRDLTELEKALS